eukprot:gene6527-6596_t
MPLKLYNTLSRSKDVFTPIDPENVRMYVCGPTVYDFAHIGNARPVIVFDLLYRLLRHEYGADHVKYVRNITDVDDKINARALRDFPDLPLNAAIAKVTSATADQFHRDVAALGCLPPNVEPLATAHIGEMIVVIEKLIAGGHAYNSDGEVLFSVPSMANYGALSGRDLSEQKAGARVAVDTQKRNPADFVLWKLSNPDEPGWDSPWGKGRPGWHIECSAMSWKHLGETFDIHGGGLDLIFPHHENEIAQSTCAFGHDMMANVWMHNGFVQVEGKKMSKSEGNFVTINDLLNTDKFGGRSWPGEVLRLAMLKTHYRQPIDFTVRALEEAESILDKWYPIANQYSTSSMPMSEEFMKALRDDLNISDAIVVMHQLFKESVEGKSFSGQRLAVCGRFMGFFNKTLAEWIAAKHKPFFVKDLEFIDSLISLRLAARAAKNWAESDRIRDELLAQGIVLKDNKDGTTTWEVKR